MKERRLVVHHDQGRRLPRPSAHRFRFVYKATLPAGGKNDLTRILVVESSTRICDCSKNDASSKCKISARLVFFFLSFDVPTARTVVIRVSIAGELCSW